MTTPQLWAADPHQYGPGKIHLIDPDKPEQTYCGLMVAGIRGKPMNSGEPTCLKCAGAPLKRQQQAAEREDYLRRWDERQKVWEERTARQTVENIEWRSKYDAYLSSPAWRDIRGLVLQRANGICEGCGRARATEVHHLTYEHLGDEFLWELKAVCGGCHGRIHPEYQ